MFTGNDQLLQPHQQPTSHGSHDHEQAPNCPRCASTNTKFCYYNNYSLTQPRYFCKACRRYWTKGGSLRNVPVGGSYRRRRRSTLSKPQSHHQYHGSPYSFNSGDNSSSSSDSGSSNAKSTNVEIDLAAVFANYLNPGSSLKTQRPVDVPDQAGFVGVDCLQESSFGHGMLRDELWSSSTQFTNWDPMVDLRELDSPPLESMSAVLEDQFFQSDSMNQVISDINWSCFDLEGYTSSFGN